MTGPKQTMMRALRRNAARRSQSRRADAMIRVSPYGAEVELADGSGRIFRQSGLDEPVISAGIRWARERGAAVIRIRR